MTEAGARSGRQGWRTCATARLVLDAREHDGMLTRHWARHIATTARQLPRWHQHQIPSACSTLDLSAIGLCMSTARTIATSAANVSTALAACEYSHCHRVASNDSGGTVQKPVAALTG